MWVNINGNWIGRHSGQKSLSSYWATHLFGEDDLLQKFDSRSGSQLVDSVGAETADIMSIEYLNDGSATWRGNKTRTAERTVDGGSYTVYFKFKQIKAFADGYADSDYLAICGGGTLASQRGMRFPVSAGAIQPYLCDGGTGRVRPIIINDVNTNILPLEWCEMFCQVDFANKLFIAVVYNHLGAEVGTPASSDISAFTFSDADSYSYWEFKNTHYVVTNFKKYNALKTIAQCRQDDYVTDLQMHYATCHSGTDISGNGLHLIPSGVTTSSKTYTNITKWGLDYGYHYERSSLYPDPANPDVVVPYDISGNSIGGRITSIINEVDGSVLHNLIDSKIRFTNDFFDRSNATIWNDTCRASDYYDSDNVKDFHISELNQRTLMSWLNDGYRGRLYVHCESKNWEGTYQGSIEDRERRLLKGIYLYNTDYKGADQLKILYYTGDKFAATSETVFDAEGYVKLGYLQAPKGFYIMRIDDGYLDCYTGWKPFFDTLGIYCTVNIHGGLVGLQPDPESGLSFMTWTQIKALIADGWEIMGTNYLDNDYASGMTFAEIDADCELNKQTIEAEGIDCDATVPNKTSSNTPTASYITWKYLHRAMIASGGYGGSSKSANPTIFNKYNLNSISYDVDEFNLRKEDNAAEIALVKAEMDDALANNKILIGFTHAYNETYMTAALTEIINYAKSIGLEIVTLKEALDQSKYL